MTTAQNKQKELQDAYIVDLLLETGWKPGQTISPQQLRDYTQKVRAAAAAEATEALIEIQERHKVPLGRSKTLEDEIAIKGRNVAMSCISIVQRLLFNPPEFESR